MHIKAKHRDTHIKTMQWETYILKQCSGRHTYTNNAVGDIHIKTIQWDTYILKHCSERHADTNNAVGYIYIYIHTQDSGRHTY